MKKIGLLVLSVITLSIFNSHLSSAQSSNFYENLKLGVKGGLNVASLSDHDRVPSEHIDARVGFYLGVLAHYHLNEKWAIQPELMYSKEGAKYDWPGNTRIGEYRGKTDLNYVQFPILIQYMVGPGFRLQTGPEAGLIINANFENDKNDESRKLDIQRVNLAWTFGIGYLHKTGFGLDARYNLGITNLYPSGVYPDQALRSRVGQLGFFYQFK